jgi:hypothetical protein
VQKREVKIPIERQEQGVELDEEVFGVAAPAVGPWQRQLNELGGVKPLAFSQCGERAWVRPKHLLLVTCWAIAEEGAEAAAKRYLTWQPRQCSCGCCGSGW